MNNLQIQKFDCCKKWDTQAIKQFIEIDYWDTLEYLVTNTWWKIPKKEKELYKLTRKTFNENTRIALWTLNATFLGAIEEYEKRIEKTDKNIKNIAALFQTYIINIENFKKQGRKDFIKWKK